MTDRTKFTFRDAQREEGSWLTGEELARCERADEVEQAEEFCSPVPTRHISNGEYMPLPQSDAQKRVESRIKELSEQASKRLNTSRRRFMQGAGGLAASFLAMNEVHGAFFNVSHEEMFENSGHHSTSNGAPPNLFVFDDQLHVVRSSFSGAGFSLRAFAQGPTTPGFDVNPFNPEGALDENGDPWGVLNPDLVGSDLTAAEFQLVQWIEDVFMNSQVTIALLSNVTAFNVIAPTGEEEVCSKVVYG